MCLCDDTASLAKLETLAADELISKAVAHDDVTHHRLPSHISTKHYAVALCPDLDNWIFEGYVALHFDLLEASEFLQFHSIDLLFHSIKIYSGHIPLSHQPITSPLSIEQKELRESSFLSEVNFSLHPETDRLLVSIGSIVPAGKYTIEFLYSGPITSSLAGFYRSFHNGTRMAVTQFQATDARRCLPCLDEPAYKASFSATVVAESTNTVLSNGPLLNSTPLDVENKMSFFDGSFFTSSILREGYTLSEFDNSPIMSTYLLAFAVGPFHFLEGHTARGTPVRVYTPLDIDVAKEGAFALERTISGVNFLEKYFAMDLPLKKLDVIGFSDVAAYAMEHYGLMTFRLVRILVNETTPHQLRFAAARTIEHELSHQYFGNLVTMHWWTHLWLNEGFARFMEFKILDELDKEPYIWESFVADPFALAKTKDSVSASHAVEVEVKNSAEIDAIFDAISYAKGASLVRMLAFSLGDAFKIGVQNYLEEFKYRNTHSDDLWRCLQTAYDNSRLGNEDSKPEFKISHVMSDWTSQVNYPVVTVSLKSVTSSSAVFTLSQRSVVNPAFDTHDNRTWVIPMTVGSILSSTGSIAPGEMKQIMINQATIEFEYVFNDKELQVMIEKQVSLHDAASSLLFNVGSTTLVRVEYDLLSFNEAVEKSPSTMGLPSPLIQAIKTRKLSVIDRIMILSDIVPGWKKGRVSLNNLLTVLEAFATETDSAPILELLSATISSMCSIDQSSSHFLKERLASMFQNLFCHIESIDLTSISAQQSVIVCHQLSILTSCGSTSATKKCQDLFGYLLKHHQNLIDLVMEIPGFDLSQIFSLQKHEVVSDQPLHSNDALDYSVIPTSCFVCQTKAKYPVKIYDTNFTCLPADLIPIALEVGLSTANPEVITPQQLLELVTLLLIRCNFSSSITTILASLPKIMCKVYNSNIQSFISKNILQACTCQCMSIKVQDIPLVFQSLCSTGKIGSLFVQNYINDWNAFYIKRFKKESPLQIPHMIIAALSGIQTIEGLTKWIEFFASKSCPEGQAGIEEALELIQRNVEFYPRAQAEIDQLRA